MKRLTVPSSLLFFLVLSSSAQAVTVCKSGCDETTIKAALNLFEYNGQDVIVKPGTYFESDLSVVDRTLRAENPADRATTIIDATGSGNFVIRKAQSATIKGFTIKGGRAGIHTSSNLVAGNTTTLDNLIIEDNVETAGAGGVQGLVDNMIISNSIIRNNTGTTGSGINFQGDSITISGCTITGNTGTGISSGGGINIDFGATAVIEDSVISSNSAINGGGISTFGTTTLNNVDLTNNTASNHGGGIYKDAIDTNDAVLNIYSSTISGNSAIRGGGIYLKGLKVTLNSFATVTGNTATEGIAGSSGGGLYCTSPDNAFVAENSITGNTPGNISSVCGTIGVPTAPPAEPVIHDTTSEHLASGDDGDPINTFTGELFSRKPRELNLGGPMPLYFQRYYAAYLKRSFIEGDLGANWRHNFDASLSWNGNDISYTSHDGRTTEFIKGGDWVQQDNTDTPYKISAEVGQNATLYDPQSERIYTFDFTTLSSPVVGKLIKVEDSHSNTHTITYDDLSGQIQTVSDELGRTLTFSYNNDSIAKISGVADGIRGITFEYNDPIDTEYLTVATNASGGVTSYQYADTSTNADHALMTVATLPRGNVPYSQTFFDPATPLASGRVATQTDADGNTYNLDYDGLDTTMTDPLGNTRVHNHTATGELANSQDTAGASIVIGSDATGRRNSITDRFGDVTTMDYHATSGKLSALTNADGTTASNTYVERTFGNVSVFDMTSISHPDASTEGFAYDAKGNLTSHTDRAGNTSSATVNSNGQPLTVSNVAGGITTNTYNADATLNTSSDPAGNTTTLGYDVLKRVNQLTFTDGNIRSMTYDDADNLLTTTDENSNTVTRTYDANGNLASLQNALLNTTTFTYDGNDRLLSNIDSPGGVTSRSFDQLGRVGVTTDPNGNSTTLNYDIHNRLNSITDPLLYVWSSTYDLEGIVASTTDPLLNTTTYTSDNMGRITQTTSPMGNTSSMTYDAMGRVTSATDALNNTTTLTLDSRGLPTGVELPGGAISASYTRNALGRITAVSDPNNNTWARDHDNMGRTISSTDPLANIQTMSYDNRNRPATVTFPGSLGSLTLAYDPAGNLTSGNYSDGTLFTYVYDASNHLTSADGITLDYDANNRIINSNGISMVRDAGGRITSMTLATAKTVTYTYDANDRVTQISDWAGGITMFSYDAAGRLISIIRPNSINTTKTYDSDSRLTELTDGAISAISLTRDANGQISNAVRSTPLVASATGLSSATNSVDAASQLSGATYDAMGRLTNEGSNIYGWNLATQLTSVTTSAGSSSASFDAMGNRLSKTASGVTRSYVWNFAFDLPSISIEQQDGSNLRYYVHTPGGALLYSIDATTDARNFYHYDEMGNTLFITDDAGSVAGSYAYSPFGKLIAETGALDNLFTWQGEHGVMDEGDGLYNIRARYYDANTARFISRDPVKSISPRKINPYQYALSNPLRFVDVNGRDTQVYGRIKLAENHSEKDVFKSAGGMGKPSDFKIGLKKRTDIPRFASKEDYVVVRGTIEDYFDYEDGFGPDYFGATPIFVDARGQSIFMPKITIDLTQWIDDLEFFEKLRFEQLVFESFNDRLYLMGHQNAFSSVNEIKFKNPEDVDFGGTTATDGIFAVVDYYTALALTEIVQALQQFNFTFGIQRLQEILLLDFLSNRESVKAPTNPDKIKSVTPEITECVVLC